MSNERYINQTHIIFKEKYKWEAYMMRKARYLLVAILVVLGAVMAPAVVGEKAVEPIRQQELFEHRCDTIQSLMMDVPTGKPLSLDDPVDRFFGELFISIIEMCILFIGHNILAEIVSEIICRGVFFLLFSPFILPAGFLVCVDAAIRFIYSEVVLDFLNDMAIWFGLVVAVPLGLIIYPSLILLWITATIVLTIPFGMMLYKDKCDRVFYWSYHYVLHGQTGTNIPDWDVDEVTE